MSDSTMKPKEPPKTCGTCRYPAHLVECFARFGTRRTNSKACECYEPAPSEQRCQQLEQIAKKMYRFIKHNKESSLDPAMLAAERYYREDLEALGVSLDD